MSDYDELDEQLSGALHRAASPAEPGDVLDRVTAKKKHRADMRSLRVKGAGLLAVVVLAATVVVATAGGSRPKTSHVASGDTATTFEGADGVVNPAAAGGDAGSMGTTTSVPNASATHGSPHGPTTTAPAQLGGAIAIDNGAQGNRVVTCQPPAPATTTGGVMGRVHFVDAKHGWVVASMGWTGILSTVDGGKTWVKTECSGYVMDVAFVTAERGWAVGDGFILDTTDGGRTWAQQTLPPWRPELSAGSSSPWSLIAVSFADATHGWAVGNGGATLSTTDGGAHWTFQTAPNRGPLLSVSFPDDKHGWAVGGSGGEIAQSTDDGGTTWTPHDGVGSNVDFVDAAHGWAGKYDGIRATTDGGATWHAQSVGTTGRGYVVHFLDLQHGWGISGGETSVVVGTTDGGATWHQLGSPPAYVYDFSFVDTVHGWVTAAGTILATNDGGQTWSSQLAE